MNQMSPVSVSVNGRDYAWPRVPAIAIGTPVAAPVPIAVCMLKSNAASGCFAVPTLAACEGLTREGLAFGPRPESAAKIVTARKGSIEPLSYRRDARLPMGYGSDLPVQLQKYPTLEFELRARALPLPEAIAPATNVAAQGCRMEGEIGALIPRAYAELLGGNDARRPVLQERAPLSET